MTDDEIMKALDFHYQEDLHDEDWKNEVAKQLNILIGMADYEFTCGCADTAIAAISIVKRVADFDKIKGI